MDLDREGSLGFYLSRNLSQGGVLLEIQGAPPELGSRVRLRLVVENEKRIITIEGKVVRHEGEGEQNLFAVQFMKMDQGSMSFLQELLGEQTGSTP